MDVLYNVADKANEGTHVGPCDEITNDGGGAASRCA